MNMFSLMCVAVGGAVGAMLRYLTGIWIGKLNTTAFPFPTLAINVMGAFLMGLWIGTMVLMLPGKSKDLHLLVAVGLLGGYTTFSTFSFESYMLLEKGLWLQAALYMVGSVLLSVAALFAGMWLMRTVH